MSDVDVFEAERHHLERVAYRLLGSWADAEDVVADAWLRWQRAPDDVRDPRAWLTRVVGRLALDELRSARHRREEYVGPWLPEPDVRRAPAGPPVDPADEAVADESMRLAFLAVLEELTAEQRIAFVLHDVLDVPFADVAAALDCSEEAARQHASRGRRRVRRDELPRQAPPAEVRRALDALVAAMTSGDLDRLARLLRDDVVLVGDGGGQVTAASRPLRGAEAVRFLGSLTRRRELVRSVDAVLVNGEPGLLVRFVPDAGHRVPPAAVYVAAVAGGRIRALWAVLNPAKLTRLPPPPPS